MKRDNNGKFIQAEFKRPEKDFGAVTVERTMRDFGHCDYPALRFTFCYETDKRETIQAEREVVITHSFATELLALVEKHSKKYEEANLKMKEVRVSENKIAKEFFD